MASIVSSDEVVESKMINIMVEFSELNAVRISSGSISMGMLRSIKLSYHTTWDSSMLYSFYLLFQGSYVFVVHSLADEHGIRSSPEFIHQDILPLHCLNTASGI